MIARTGFASPSALRPNLVATTMDLGAAKLLGILFESLGYGEHSPSLVPCARPHRSLP